MNMKQIREEMTTVRIYGRVLQRWWINRETGEIVRTGGWRDPEGRKYCRDYSWRVYQDELAYTEYRLDGSIRGTGSRDFLTKKPWEGQDVKTYTLKVWDGEKRWKGGQRCFDECDSIVTDPSTRPSDLIRVLRVIRPYCRDAAEIRLEK